MLCGGCEIREEEGRTQGVEVTVGSCRDPLARSQGRPWSQQGCDHSVLTGVLWWPRENKLWEARAHPDSSSHR